MHAYLKFGIMQCLPCMLPVYCDAIGFSGTNFILTELGLVLFASSLAWHAADRLFKFRTQPTVAYIHTVIVYLPKHYTFS